MEHHVQELCTVNTKKIVNCHFVVAQYKRAMLKHCLKKKIQSIKGNFLNFIIISSSALARKDGHKSSIFLFQVI